MVDYQLPMVVADKQNLKDNNCLVTDAEKSQHVNYKQLLGMIRPAKKVVSQDIVNVCVTVQRMWRGVMARRRVKNMKSQNLQNVKSGVKGLGKDSIETTLDSSSPSKKKPAAKKGKMSKGDMDKKKRDAAKQQRLGRRAQGGLDNKMNQVVKPVRDPKAMERAKAAKADLESFIKDQIIDKCITASICYGESLDVCRGIQ